MQKIANGHYIHRGCALVRGQRASDGWSVTMIGPGGRYKNISTRKGCVAEIDRWLKHAAVPQRNCDCPEVEGATMNLGGEHHQEGCPNHEWDRTPTRGHLVLHRLANGGIDLVEPTGCKEVDAETAEEELATDTMLDAWRVGEYDTGFDAYSRCSFERVHTLPPHAAARFPEALAWLAGPMPQAGAMTVDDEDLWEAPEYDFTSYSFVGRWARPEQSENREDWMHHALRQFRVAFKVLDVELPEKIRIAVGFPRARGGLGPKAIGQAWSPQASADGTHEIFISPIIGDPSVAMETLLHELVHQAVGVECGHRGKFKQTAERLGFMSPMKETPPSEELHDAIVELCEWVGEYPHAALIPGATPKKNKNRHKLLVCAADCGLKMRASKGAIEEHGAPEHCGEEMSWETE